MNYQEFIDELSKMFVMAFKMKVSYDVTQPGYDKLVAIKTSNESYNKVSIFFYDHKTKYKITVETNIFVDDTMPKFEFISGSDMQDLEYDIQRILAIKISVIDNINKNMRKIRGKLERFLSDYNGINL